MGCGPLLPSHRPASRGHRCWHSSSAAHRNVPPDENRTQSYLRPRGLLRPAGRFGDGSSLAQARGRTGRQQSGLDRDRAGPQHPPLGNFADRVGTRPRFTVLLPPARRRATRTEPRACLTRPRSTCRAAAAPALRTARCPPSLHRIRPSPDTAPRLRGRTQQPGSEAGTGLDPEAETGPGLEAGTGPGPEVGHGTPAPLQYASLFMTSLPTTGPSAGRQKRRLSRFTRPLTPPTLRFHTRPHVPVFACEGHRSENR